MSLLFARPIPGVSSGVMVVLFLNAVPLHASSLPQDRSLADLDDPLVRSEILELGGYQELVMEFTTPTLIEGKPPAKYIL